HLALLAERHDVDVLAADRGLSLGGPDLGSPSAPVVEAIRPVLLTGAGLRATHAGYIWHWFDTRLNQPLTQIDWRGLSQVDLADYTHLILPDGNYEGMPAWASERITSFVLQGGTLVAARGASAWVEELALEWEFAGSADDDAVAEAPERRAYGDFTDDFARELIGGSALNVELDITHPLAFGYQSSDLVVFRRGRHILQSAANAYVNPAFYAEQALAAGYLSAGNSERLSGTPALVATHNGQGRVVRMADDYLFRGYWLGTERLFANALFFSQLVQPTVLPGNGSAQ
ncbi:MAG: hypothetical protein ACNA7J_13640, partial [Wenzhouxiangella sp.]